MSSLTIGVYTGKWFDDIDRATLAEAENMFRWMCFNCDPIFGYSFDQFVDELLTNEMHLALPPGSESLSFLFWLSYMPLSLVSAEDFGVVNAHVEPVERGLIVKLFGSPEDVDLTRLLEVNRVWSRSFLKFSGSLKRATIPTGRKGAWGWGNQGLFERGRC